MNKNSFVAPMGAASAPSTGRRRIDVKALMSMHLRPYAIVKNWRDEFEILKEYSARFARDVNGEVMALRDDYSVPRVETLLLACDLRDALPPRDAIEQAKMMILSALQVPFDEPNCRLLIGIMCDVMKGRAEDETAAVSIDMMTWRLEELRLDHEDDDLAAPTAAIAGAVAQLIDEQSFRPSIHEVRDRVIEHWRKLAADLRAVGGLSSFVATLDELVPADAEAAPIAWCDGYTDDGSIPF